MTVKPRQKLLFFLLLALLAIWFSPAPEATQATALTYERGKVILPTTPATTLQVDMALNWRTWQQGMMYRKEWGDIEGMLFMFPDEEPRSFWMKNTYLPLDIIYLDHTARIVHIAADAKPLDKTNIPSHKPAQMALEIAAGKAKQYGLKEGDVLIVER